MSINLFVILVTILSLVNSLFTEAFKKVFQIERPTLLSAILAGVIGWLGGVFAFILMNIPFTLSSGICLFLLAPTVWLGATLGYDKVKKVIEEIGVLTK